MKIRVIDNKGRLFGKINILDFLVLVFLICLAPLTYFGVEIYNYEQEKKAKAFEAEQLARTIREEKIAGYKATIAEQEKMIAEREETIAKYKAIKKKILERYKGKTLRKYFEQIE